MGKTLIYKIFCGCEFWEGLDFNGNIYPEMQYCKKHEPFQLAQLRQELDDRRLRVRELGAQLKDAYVEISTLRTKLTQAETELLRRILPPSKRYIKGGDGSHWEGCEETHWDCKIKKLEAENAELRKAVEDAIEFAEEGWSYASDYFKEKWEYEKRLAELKQIAHPAQKGKS